MSIKNEQLGLATALLCQSKTCLRYPIASIKLWLMPAIQHRQIQFAFASDGRPIAYWTWALVLPETELRLIQSPAYILHISEWNEGDNLFLMDLVAPHGRVDEVVRVIRDHQFAGYEHVRWNRTSKFGKTRTLTFNRKPKQATVTAFDGRLQLTPNDCASSLTDWKGRIA